MLRKWISVLALLCRVLANPVTYVTVHAKTSLVRTKIKIAFLAQLIATHISYLHSMSPMARLNWSAFLGGDLQSCKTMTATIALVECANWV